MGWWWRPQPHSGMSRRVRSGRSGGTVAVALLQALLCAGGCAGTRETACPPFDSLRGPAAADSLGVEVFLNLTPEERASRRARAREFAEAARRAANTRVRAEALMKMVSLAPDDPRPWLDLAELWRWAGDYLHAENCLDRAAEAVRKWVPPDAGGPLSRSERDGAAARTAVLRAWLHYDRAEWPEGMRWVRAAAALEAGHREVWLIQGLLEAASGHYSQAHEIAGDIRRKGVDTGDAAWILAVLDLARGQAQSAFEVLGRGGTNRSIREHAAEYWRDRGMIAERVGEWGWARFWYDESRAAVPLESTKCVAEMRGPRLGSPGDVPEMPVWLAFGRYYVTGSLSAYAALAFTSFEAAATPADREFWAGAVVNAAGILHRRGEDGPWALRARGLVFAERGMADRGLSDLRRAARQLSERGAQDARVEAGIGHLHLVRQDHLAARPHLERAVGLDPGLADAWSDLGLAFLMGGQQSAAREAFGRAVELDDGLVTAWYNRGLMRLHAGELDAAAEDLEKAARLAPDNQDVARALQQLESRRRQQAE